MKKYDVCIIGGGAAGLAAAASLNNSISICMLEKNEIPGKKIMATGGGRCNITNAACEGKDLTLDFFKSLGLETYSDNEGRYFPYSNHAPDVVKILLGAIKGKGADLITDICVDGISCSKGYFFVSYEKGKCVLADNVIMAMGGKAAPQFGTTGDGYSIAKSLGHSIEKVYPILAPIQCGDFRTIKGVRARGTVSLYKDGDMICRQTGEIQFTEDGISGICVFNITPYIKADEGEQFHTALKRYVLELDLAPDFTQKQLEKRSGSFGILSDKLASCVSLDNIKRWRIPVKGVKGWKNAQCTAGGVCLNEIYMDSMESKIVKGLFFAGEIINVQGPCGGYNLQKAWETAIRAAETLNGRLK